MNPLVRAVPLLAVVLATAACRPPGLGGDHATAATTPAQPVSVSYAGVWQGTVKQASGNVPAYTVHLSLSPGQPGAQIGTISLIAPGGVTLCSGFVRLGSDYSGGTLVPITTEITDNATQTCVPATTDQLTVKGPTRLGYTMTQMSKNGQIIAEGADLASGTLTKAG